MKEMHGTSNLDSSLFSYKFKKTKHEGEMKGLKVKRKHEGEEKAINVWYGRDLHDGQHG